MQTCTGCQETKGFDSFFRDKRKLNGYMPRCKVCKGNYWKKWRRENPDFDRLRYWANKDTEEFM